MRIFVSILFIASLAGCRPTGQPAPPPPGSNTGAQVLERDTTPKVTGIGGIFFRADNKDSLTNWYGEHLGLAINPYGSVFEFRNANRPDEVNYLSWGIFSRRSAYFPVDQECMINYRVQNLDGLLRNFREHQVTILDSVVTVEYGKFVHIADPEGNWIELWEPVDSWLMQLGTETTR